MPDQFTPIVAIYGLIDPRTGCIRYVGKTVRPAQRLKLHLTDPEDNYKARWVRSLQREGLNPEMVILQWVHESAWESAEQWWIAHFREHGADLTNGTAGGDGCHNPPDWVRARMGEAHKGLVKSEETRRKLSVANSHPKSPEGRAAIRAAANRPEKRAKLSAALNGKPKSAAHVEAIRRAARSPEKRAKLSKSLKGRVFSEEHIRNMSGEARGTSKLTEAAVAEIREAWQNGATFTELGRRFGVSRRTVSRACIGFTWSVVPGAVPRDERTLCFRGRVLTQEIADLIRRDYSTGAFLMKDLASRFGVSKSTVHLIVHNRIWAAGASQSSNGQNSGKMLSSSEKLGIGMSILTEGSGIGGNGSDGKLQSDMVPHGEMNTEVDATPAEPLELGTPTTAAVAGVAAAPMSVAPNTNMP